MIEISMQELLDIAERDLRRVGKKFKLAVLPKSDTCNILWEGSDIECAKDYSDFKNSYLYAEDTLRKWLDCQRWLHKVDFSNCWLTISLSGGCAKWIVCKAV